MTNRTKAIQAIHAKLKSRKVEIVEVHHKYIPKKHVLKRVETKKNGKVYETSYKFGGFTTIIAIHDGKFPPITVTSFRSGYDKWDKVEEEFQCLRKLVGMLPEIPQKHMRGGTKACFMPMDEFNNMPSYRFHLVVK